MGFEKDGIQSTGMFYMRDMLPNYFSKEMALGLQEMINEANHSSEIVVALIFDSKALSLRLAKSDSDNVIEIVPPIFH